MGKPPAAKHWEVLRRSGPCCVRICGGRRRHPFRRPGCGRHNFFAASGSSARFGIGQDLAVPERRVGAAAAKDRAVLYRVDARVRSHIDADTRGRDEIHTVCDRIPPRHGRVRKLVVFNAERAELQRQLGAASAAAERRRARRWLPAAAGCGAHCNDRGARACTGYRRARHRAAPCQHLRECLGRQAVIAAELLVERVDQKRPPLRFQHEPAAADQCDPHCSSSRNSCSESTGTPSSCALRSLLPAFSPATTYVVFFRDGRGGLTAERLDLLRRLLARKQAQRAGQDKGLARKARIRHLVG